MSERIFTFKNVVKAIVAGSLIAGCAPKIDMVGGTVLALANTDGVLPGYAGTCTLYKGDTGTITRSTFRDSGSVRTENTPAYEVKTIDGKKCIVNTDSATMYFQAPAQTRQVSQH